MNVEGDRATATVHFGRGSDGINALTAIGRTVIFSSYRLGGGIATRALINGNGFEAQRHSLVLIRNANQANMAVTGFGFMHCLIPPTGFL